VTTMEPQAERVYSGHVEYASGGGVSDAAVAIPLDSHTYRASTNNSGSWTIAIPDDVALPAKVIATIDHVSIMPEAESFPGNPGTHSARSSSCTKIVNHVYVKDAGLHHLGNDRYGGSPNSQLQVSTEGLEKSYTFHLDQAPGRMPMIRLYARGIQERTEIKINGISVDYLGDSDSSGGLSRYNFRLTANPSTVLHGGTNTLTIRTGAYTESDPWDDVEFCSLILYFE